MAGNGFEKVIEEAFTEVDPKTKKKVTKVPKVQGTYQIKTNTDMFELKLDNTKKDPNDPNGTTDFDNFKKLFTVKPVTGGIGNGEVALFWLFGGMNNNKTKHLGGNNQPDLLLNNNNVEVKAYTSTMVKVGKFESQKDFTTMLTIIFSISNFVNKENQLLTTSSFDYDRVQKAADNFCITREALLSAKRKMTPEDQKIFESLDIFSGILKKAELFDDTAKKVGLTDIVCNPNDKERAGGENIAKELLKFGAQSVLKNKPGHTGENPGFFCIIESDQGTFATDTPITFYKIINNKGKINLNTRKLNKLHELVNITSSNLFINFSSLFSRN